MQTLNPVSNVLEAKKMEWENLYLHPEFETLYKRVLPDDLTDSEKSLLASLWYCDAISGRRIDFAQSTFELRCLTFTRSRRNLIFFSLACATHISLPFLKAPYCPWSNYINNVNQSHDDQLYPHYPTRDTLISIEFFILIIYFAELTARLFVNNLHNFQAKNYRIDLKDKWTTFRLICVFAIFLDVLCDAGNISSFRWTTGLVPFVYISRRKSLRQMLQGLIIATYQTYGVLLLLLTTLFVWSYAGYLLFRNFETETENRFSNLWESFLTCLHIFASRTFSILALNPYFKESSVASLFFVTLTIGADLLCSSLLIAIGSREYRKFASEVFRKQSKKRRFALESVFELLAVNDRLHLNEWINMCSYVKGKSYIPRATARALFLMECNNVNDVSLNCKQFFRLAAIASSNVVVKVSDTNTSDGTPRDVLTMQENKPQPDILISEKNVSNDEKPLNDSPKLIKKVKLSANFNLPEPPQEVVLDSSYMWEVLQEESNDDSSRQSGMSGMSGPSRHSSVEKSHPLDVTYPSKKSSKRKGAHGDAKALDSNKSPLLDQSAINPLQVEDVTTSSRATSISLFAESEETTEGTMLERFRRRIEILAEDFSVTFSSFSVGVMEVSFEIPLGNNYFELNVFECFFYMVPLALMIQLVVITSDDDSEAWRTVGWVLEALFWVEMLIRMGAVGVWKALHSVASVLQAFINIFSLILVIALDVTGANTQRASILVTLYIVVHLFRFFRLYKVVQSFDIFEKMIPVFLYVSLLIFSIIYFFSSFAFNRFCSSMSVSNAENNDDDSSAWVPYADQLNFLTFAQSVYTLFQLSILGNWSMVMDTIAKVDRVSSLFFFYLYRLGMTLCVMPLLFSFIIQIFIIRKDNEEKNAKEKKKRKERELMLSDSISSPITSSLPTPKDRGNDHNNYSGTNTTRERSNTVDSNKAIRRASNTSMDDNKLAGLSVSSYNFQDMPTVSNFINVMDRAMRSQQFDRSVSISGMSLQSFKVNDGIDSDRRPLENSISRRGSGGNDSVSDTQSFSAMGLESLSSRKIDQLRKESAKVSVRAFNDTEDEVTGMNLWKSTDPMLRTQLEVKLKENDDLKALLMTATTLLKEEHRRADMNEQERIKVIKLLDSGLMSHPAMGGI